MDGINHYISKYLLMVFKNDSDVNIFKISCVMLKVLVHGWTGIKKAILPIGQLSEEATGARNKLFK